MTNQELEILSYNCQIGMYFSGIKNLTNGFVVYSNIVEDESWNFFTGFSAKTIEEFFSAPLEAKNFLNSINRKLCIAISPSTKVSNKVKTYIKDNFFIAEETVTLLCNSFSKKHNLSNEFSFRKIDNNTEKELFIKTFKTSKTQTLETDTYSALATYYFDALETSFNNKTDWTFKHYLSFYNNSPIGMVSVCQKDSFAGLYGGGTFIKFRGQGVFTNLLNHISYDLSKEGVTNFFGITQKNSTNEKFYNNLGWHSKFSTKLFIEKY